MKTFEEFCNDIENEKAEMKNEAWFCLYKAVKGNEVSKIQMDSVKEILDRIDGKPAQVIKGDKDNPIEVSHNFKNATNEQLSKIIKESESGNGEEGISEEKTD